MKDSGFRVTERLLPASSPSRALCARLRLAVWLAEGQSLSTPLRSWLVPLVPLACAFGTSDFGLKLGPRGPLQPQPVGLAGIWHRLLTSATNTKAGHTLRTIVPHSKRRFRRDVVALASMSLFWGVPFEDPLLGGNTAWTVSGAFPEPKPRPDVRNASCAGRIRSSQRARCGAEANSNSFEHLACHRSTLPRKLRAPGRAAPAKTLLQPPARTVPAFGRA